LRCDSAGPKGKITSEIIFISPAIVFIGRDAIGSTAGGGEETGVEAVMLDPEVEECKQNVTKRTNLAHSS